MRKPWTRMGARAALRALGLALLLAPGAAAGQAGSASTADHSVFEALKETFASGPEVTEACLSCHTEAAEQLRRSIHFTWEFEHPATGQLLGKRHVINSFCGNVAGNEARCTSCHAGYGWEDMSRPAARQAEAVDCLVCHDRSGQYAKMATTAGGPPLSPVPEGAKTITGADATPVDLGEAARSVGEPGRENCGMCHFYGGGGDNVKHGDLSSALNEPSREVDVHMAAKSEGGQGFVCATCHLSEAHQWPGSRYAVRATDPEGTGLPGERRRAATCESCHGTEPHPASVTGIKLNDHVDALACQSCHIPSFARGGVATKMWWDWSEAGKLRDGRPYSEEGHEESDGDRRDTYLSTKGAFRWGENVTPFYAWFDGQMRYTTGEMEIDPERVVEINRIGGGRDDPASRIWPFKVMEGRQAYDVGTKRLAYTHVWGPATDTAFWTNFDWDRAIAAGMEAAGQDYSGEYGFVDTKMHWPVTHMVAPAEQAVECGECHSDGGRMAGVAGVYMPGADPWRPATLIGLALVAAATLGVAGHAALRIISGGKGGGHE